MRDVDVRQALTANLAASHGNDPSTLIRQELGLDHGQVFVDVAVINGEIHGYELKSDRDTLERLPRQVEVYSSVLDRATLVVGSAHLPEALHIVPSWWGIEIATAQSGGIVQLSTMREAQTNPRLQPLAVARLLWRDEALEVLESLGAAKGIRSKARKYLYERLVEVMPTEALRAEVRHRLKSREGW